MHIHAVLRFRADGDSNPADGGSKGSAAADGTGQNGLGGRLYIWRIRAWASPSGFSPRTGASILYNARAFGGLMPPALELRNISVVRDGRRILDRVSLDIQEGENVAIIGLNGSGKTTLLKLLRGDVFAYDDDEPYSMRIFGQDRWNVRDLRSRMGVVSMDLQDRFNPGTTVREVIGSGFFGSLDIFRNMTVTPAMEEKILYRATEMGIEDLLPREIGGLSLGEMRRTLIARALVTDPSMLILDEPMTGLDIVMKSLFRRMFDILTDTGVNIIMITHDLTDIPLKLERVIMIKDGRIYRDGSKTELLDSRTVSGLYGADIAVESTGGIYRMYLKGSE